MKQILIIYFLTQFFPGFAFSAEVKKIEFDCAKKNNINEKEMVMNLIYPDKADSEQDNKIPNDMSETEICIAKYDLNEDGINEIFAKLCSYELYGNMQCQSMIYEADKEKRLNLIAQSGYFAMFKILTDKTDTFYDLITTIKIPCDQPKNNCMKLSEDGKKIWDNVRWATMKYSKNSKQYTNCGLYQDQNQKLF